MKLMFCARLKNYLTYYCHSRAIDDFDDFFSLCVADKLKSTLSEACLDHVLTAEGNTWHKCDDLAHRRIHHGDGGGVRTPPPQIFGLGGLEGSV
jgi:hypothetical protein